MTKKTTEVLKWTPAPKKISFGTGMSEALVEIDKDHTLTLYAETEVVHMVVAALQKALERAK